MAFNSLTDNNVSCVFLWHTCWYYGHRMSKLIINLIIKKMKNLILIMVAFAIIGSLSAQEKVKQKEVGLVFRNFDNFGVLYKFGHQKSMWRAMAISGNMANRESKSEEFERVTNAYNFGFSFGKQFTTPLAENMDFIYGIDLKYAYSYIHGDRQSEDYPELDLESVDKTHIPGMNLVLGFNYIIKGHMVIGAELLPGFSYSMSKMEEVYENETERNSESETSQIYVGISSSSAMLTLAYRF